MNEKTPRNLSPQEVILKAFEYFQAKEKGMDQSSLINVCLAAGCPNCQTAVQVLEKMVLAGQLRVEETKEFGRIYKPTPSSHVRLN